MQKLNEQRVKRGAEPIEDRVAKTQLKKKKISKLTKEDSADKVTAQFIEDDNFIDMDISGIRSAFPSEDEDEDEYNSNQSDKEQMESQQEQSINNNATARIEGTLQRLPSATRPSPRTSHDDNQVEPIPHCSSDDPGVKRKVNSPTRK